MKKRWLALFTCVVMLCSIVLTGCGDQGATTTPSDGASNGTTPSDGASNGTTPSDGASNPSTPAPDDGNDITEPDVTDATILVGNTAATTGAFAAVGVPFNAGLEAALKAYNDAGGFEGRTIELIHYDDGFDAAQGMTYTQTLVEDDQVFALVGHFGTNTVGATLDYLKSVGIPMMHAATGISTLYQEHAMGKDACIFPVQPIYNAEGRVLLARAVASTEDNIGLGGTKIGVIATTDDAGSGILAGINRQLEEIDVEVVIQEVDPAAADYTAAASVLKNAGCDVVIGAMNQAPFQNMMNSMRDIAYDAKVITSYVSASAAFLGELVASGAVTANRPVYTTSWLDIATEQGAAELAEFMAVQLAWEAEQGIAQADGYSLNSYAMAGYVAAKLFIHGLEQVEAQGLELTWENYIAAAESVPYHIPMGGDIDFSDGARLGVTALSLNTISLETNPDTGAYDLLTVSPIMSLDDVMAAVG